MTTTVTKSIGSAGGRDYSTLAAAITAISANLVTADELWILELYNDSEFTNSGVFADITGKTTDATHTITIRPASGQGFYDNANKLTNALKYNASNGVALRSTGGGGSLGMIQVAIDYVFIEGLQFQNSGVGSPNAIRQTGVGTHCIFKDLLCEQLFGADFQSSCMYMSGATAVNCLGIVATGNSGSIGFHSDGNTAKFRNCAALCLGSTAGSRGFRGNYDTPLYLNCAAFGFTTAFANSTNATNDYNATDTAAAPGTHSIKNKTFANQFVDITNTSSRDLRVKAGADLINAGTRDATNTGDLDIIKQARSITTPTIGVWEFIPVGGFVPPDWPHRDRSNTLLRM